jgi:acetoacetyl-CoA synthetase
MAPRAATTAFADEALLWTPSNQQTASANITQFMEWLRARGRRFESYDDLWRWSVTDLEAFWGSVWEFFDITAHRPYDMVLTNKTMPGAQWFEGAELNYSEHAFRRRDSHPAVVSQSETRPLTAVTYADLYRQTATVAAGLKSVGVRRGDRVASYMPNIPETVVAFLATASIGAIWSSCSPDFGVGAVVDRFQQIDPKVLFAADGYQYNGKPHNRMGVIADIRRQLPGLECTVLVPYLDDRPPSDEIDGARLWSELAESDSQELGFEPVPFEHPLWVLYSSGTTGLPKPIVQGHGGIVLEHLKMLSLHLDLSSDDRFFWHTTTGWMMWNFLISGLMVGATVVLYDGSPGYPDMNTLWRLAEETRMSYFGTSAPYLLSCMKAGIEPGRDFDLGELKGIGSTGAPLPPEGFKWIYEKVSDGVLLGSVSGGTDLCTAVVGSCPLLPVHAGEIQCRALGAAVEAFDADANPVIDEVGELVITEPLPSMPLYFWNDPGFRRYRESYFDMFPGVWRHGDWIKITPRGSCVIYGRSDSTLNRGGVRMGTSEFYRVVEALPEVADSLVVDTGSVDGDQKLFLFVVPAPGSTVDERLKDLIKETLRAKLSPRHVPDVVHQIPEVPRTLNGKKLEVPVKRILMGTPIETVLKADAVTGLQSISFIAQLAQTTEEEVGS